MVKGRIVCPAKINLFLEVLSKREDSYHDIDTVMQKIDLADIMNVSSDIHGEIRIRSESKNIPLDEKNIVYKTAKAYFDYFSIENPGLNIEIIKNIPTEAGLGGGSSDGAGILRFINNLYNKADLKTLVKIASGVGADIPFFLYGPSARCRGIGEIVEECPPVRADDLLIIKSEVNVSTKYAYSLIDSYERKYKSADRMVKALAGSENETVFGELYNAFEKPIVSGSRELEKVRAFLLENSLGCLMSGSGSAFFAFYDSPKKAKEAYEKAERLSFKAYLTKTVY